MRDQRISGVFLIPWFLAKCLGKSSPVDEPEIFFFFATTDLTSKLISTDVVLALFLNLFTKKKSYSLFESVFLFGENYFSFMFYNCFMLETLF